MRLRLRCGCHLVVISTFIVVGNVIGGSSICTEVPDRGALLHETATQTVDSFSTDLIIYSTIYIRWNLVFDILKCQSDVNWHL
jgi:hypothetical protein